VEEVQCGECGLRYDSDENPFCPRCGSLSRGRDVSGAVATAGRRDPDLRRVRAAGVVLMVLGGLAAAQFLWATAFPPEPDADLLELFAGEEFVANVPGGSLRLQVTEDGTAVEVPVVVRAMNGTVLVEAATVGGWYNATLPVAFANVTVGGTLGGAAGGSTGGNATGLPAQVHKVYVSSGEALDLHVDLGEAQAGPEWHAASTVPFVRPLLGFLSFMAIVVVAGGVAAWRLRLMGLAVTGAVLAVLPGLVALGLDPLSGLLLAFPGVLALVFILRGRRHFRRRA